MSKNKYLTGPPIWAQNYRLVHGQNPIITVSERDQHQNKGRGDRGYRQRQYYNNDSSHYNSNGGSGYNNRNSKSGNNNSKTTNSSAFTYNLFGLTQRDPLTQTVAEWVHYELDNIPIEDLQQVEIEVKLGTITEKATLNRTKLPVSTECVLNPAERNPAIYFDASVNEAYFKKTVSFLDNLVKTKRSSGDSDKLEAYPNQYNLDLFYDSPWDSNKIRVSLNENNMFIDGIVKKTIASLEIYSPGDLVDFRISINLEKPVSEQLLAQLQASKTAPKFQREKNRLTYIQSVLKIDLTSVDMPTKKKTQQTAHGSLNKKEDEIKKEIEIELNPNVVLECFQLDQSNRKRDNGEPSNLELLLGYLLNNTRLIIRNFSRSRDSA